MFSPKAELRNAALQRRDAIEPEARAQFAARLAEIGPDLLARIPAQDHPVVVSLYSPIGSEPDPSQLAAILHARDVPLALPVDWSHGTQLVYRRWIPGDPLAAGPLGIGEPLAGVEECDPDILFMPLAAFDRRGYRIGYGAGNVDRAVRALRARKTILVIGVAYAVQEEAAVPNDPHDEPVDLFVTECEIVEAVR